jgi:hypothetical protein
LWDGPALFIFILTPAASLPLAGGKFSNEDYLMRLARIALLVAISLLALLASAQEPQSAVLQTANGKSSKGTVYVYRYKQFVGKALSPSVYCDETQLARMENGRYFTVKLDPGKHSFRSNDQQSGLDLEVKAGEEYFIRVEIATGFMKGHGRLVLVPREQGGYELNSDKLKALDADKILDKGLVSTENAHLQTTAAESKK